MKGKRNVGTLFSAFNFARNFRSSVEKIEEKEKGFARITIFANTYSRIKYESFGAETVAK